MGLSPQGAWGYEMTESSQSSGYQILVAFSFVFLGGTWYVFFELEICGREILQYNTYNNRASCTEVPYSTHDIAPHILGRLSKLILSMMGKEGANAMRGRRLWK